MITKAGVPSNMIVPGITSYGRSFQISAAGCYGELCTYTGPLSGATPGRCTQVPGYISDAEIKEIISQNSNTLQYLDAGSQTNVLVYNDNQWIGWLDSDQKDFRRALFAMINMGGVCDWAVDLEDFIDGPQSFEWSIFKETIAAGTPYVKGNRTGDWTTQPCTNNEFIAGLLQHTPQERWAGLDCDNAWQDALNVWYTIDKPAKNGTFSESISDTFHAKQKMNCQSLSDYSCDSTFECTDTVGAGSGPAAYEVMNSLTSIHSVRYVPRKPPGISKMRNGKL